MADNQVQAATGFPPAEVPVAFCDGVANFVHSQHVAKYYLFRTDPNLSDASQYENRVVAQVVMPVPAFLNAFALFEAGVERMIESGIIQQSALDDTRAALKALK